MKVHTAKPITVDEASLREAMTPWNWEVMEIDGEPGRYVKAEVAEMLLTALIHVKTGWTLGGSPFTGTEKKMVELAIQFADEN